MTIDLALAYLRRLNLELRALDRHGYPRKRFTIAPELSTQYVEAIEVVEREMRVAQHFAECVAKVDVELRQALAATKGE